MNYTQFTNRPNNLQKLLVKLGILTAKKIIIRIDNTPDYDISDYKREIDTDYFFNNFWDFSNELQSVVDINIIESKLYHFNDLEKASKKLNLFFDNENHTQFLNDIYSVNADWFFENGMEPDIDQFKLHTLRKSSIDNISRHLYYEGSFFGNHETFNPIDWGLYSLVELIGVPHGSAKFYKDLIGESFILHNENKNTLSYFLSYSAFESFINSGLGTINDERRLKEKITELYRAKFSQLETHQIYTSIINEYNIFTTKRNNIAHGTNSISISKEDVISALFFILTLISSFEFNCSTFDELTQQI